MIRNYIKIAWRNLVKSKLYSVINVAGLCTGMSFTLVIAAFVWNEVQVNRQLKNAENQFIIQSKWKNPDMGIELTTLGPLASELKVQYPNLVANYYRWDGVTSNVSKGSKAFREGLQIGDSTLFTMYGFKLLHGDVNTALNSTYSLVITETRAIKYFGKTDVVGEALTIESFSGTKKDFVITGVLKKPSRNSVTYINYENNNQFYISTSSLSFFGRNIDNWNNQYVVGYVELKPGVRPEDLEKPIAKLIQQNASPQVKENLKAVLVPLKEYHLNSDNGVVRKMIYALSFVTVFILAMAVINFVNMSISRSASRMKEIGIRKVLGGLKKQIRFQFIIESIILVLIATIISFIVYGLSKDFFSQVLGKELPSLTAFPAYFIVFPILFALLVGIIAGFYPALVLSSLKSVDSLKGQLKTVKENVLLRKSLVGFQFGTATIAFIGAMVISKQVSHFFNKDLGYNKEYVVAAQVPRDWSTRGVEKLETIRNEFARAPVVSEVSLSYEIPDGGSGGIGQFYKASSDSTLFISSEVLVADENYAKTYELKMKHGEFFSSTGVYDSLKIVVNETAARALGWKNSADALGQQVKLQGSNSIFTISGISGDHHFGSMHKSIPPITFLNVKLVRAYRYFSFRLKPGSTAASMDILQKKWAQLLPGTPFEYSFIDDTLKKLYQTELQLKKASLTATVLSVIIVLLGVLGLISLNIQKRTKEIGIRKVLGSSVSAIIGLFMKEFLVIIIIAGLIACPVAYYLMNSWLNDYAYRINISFEPFMISIAILALVTAMLIGIQTSRAANANPTRALKSE